MIDHDIIHRTNILGGKDYNGDSNVVVYDWNLEIG